MRSLIILLGLASGQAFAQGVEVVVRCQANLAPLGPAALTVQITKSQGGMQALIDGKLTNPNVREDEYPIRPDLNLKTDPYSREAASLTEGERSLVHIQTLRDDPNMREFIKLPFDPARVRRMRIFDLQGKQDKFGGTVLMEAYGQDGKLLGRAFRSLMVGACR